MVLAVFGVILLVRFDRGRKYEAFLEKFDYESASAKGLPVLLGLGWKGCSGCMQMKPVLEQLNQKYSDQFAVGYIDVRQDRSAFNKVPGGGGAHFDFP